MILMRNFAIAALIAIHAHTPTSYAGYYAIPQELSDLTNKPILPFKSLPKWFSVLKQDQQSELIAMLVKAAENYSAKKALPHQPELIDYWGGIYFAHLSGIEFAENFITKTKNLLEFTEGHIIKTITQIIDSHKDKIQKIGMGWLPDPWNDYTQLSKKIYQEILQTITLQDLQKLQNQLAILAEKM